MAKDAKTIDNDTGGEVLDPRKALSEQSLAVDLAGAEIDRQIATAHRYPRSIDLVLKKISTFACYNEDAAESCVYSLPRANKPIIGPSIGFASIVMQSWGNNRAGSQIVYIDTKQKVVKCQGAFLDLESNVQTIVPVDRRIADSKGRLYSEDMQVVTGQAGASIALRNAILRAVPRGLWYPVWLDALGIVRGNVTTFEEKKAKAFAAMTQFGVTAEKILLYLGLKGMIEFTLEHIPHVRGMYAQLRDGTMTVEEMFDPRRMTGKGFEVVQNPLSDVPDHKTVNAAAATATPTATATPAAETSPEAAEEFTDEAPFEVSDAAEVSGQAPKAREEPAKTVSPAVTPREEPKAAPKALPAELSKLSDAPANKTPPSPEYLTTPEEYLAYWEGFLAVAKSTTQVSEQWSADRSVRTKCSVIQKHFTDATQMRDVRIADLKAAKGG